MPDCRRAPGSSVAAFSGAASSPCGAPPPAPDPWDRLGLLPAGDWFCDPPSVVDEELT
jgi:hypothetical protein